MQVYKLCMKIYKKNLKIISIYFVVFFFVSFMMMSNISTSQPTTFSDSKRNVAWVGTETSVLIEGLKQSLSQRANLIAFEEDVDLLQDALYFSQVEYVIRIPEGFTNSFEEAFSAKGGTNQEIPKLIVTSVPGSTSKIYLEMAIDQFLGRVGHYRQVLGDDVSMATMVDYAIEDLKFEIPVNTYTGETDTVGGPQQLINYVFNYLSYTLMFVLILGVSTIMIVFNKDELKRRNMCSPIPQKRIHLELFMANGMFSLMTWAALVLFSLAFANKEVWHVNTLIYILNSFVFCISVTSISFLIGTLAKNREAINAIANVFTLGTCFLSGVFVPQMLLGESVLKIASFLPTYWFVLANERIAQSTLLSSEQLKAIFSAMGIELAFGVAFFALALALRVGQRGRVPWFAVK